MENVNVTFRMPREWVESLDELGAITERDRTYLFKQAVSQYLASQKWQIEEVKRAIAEADAGMVMTHEEFVSRVASWR
jgi:RHH-type rel operon transcriptional repressor/antitoxin RelB